jgi:membrane protease YdiL (CAAX protease family)
MLEKPISESGLISPRGPLIAELIILFIGLPLAVAFYPLRWLGLATLLGATFYACARLSRMPGFSWRDEWRGRDLARADLKQIVLRFAVSTLAIAAVTWRLNPDMLFAFPRARLTVWAIVMAVYPVLSALPQEILFRTYFFRRYDGLFRGGEMLLASAAAFAFAHLLFHNIVAPALAGLCGYFLGWSYCRHGSLGRVALEHALYGDMVFTVGLGIYFVLGHR